MLALIAGSGRLPATVAAAQATPPVVCALTGFAPDGLAVDHPFRLEQLGTLIAELQRQGATEVCFCGAIRRPVVDPSAIDAATMPLVPVLMQAIGAGDDSALRAVLGIFEDKGFTVRAAHELAPEILAPEGVLTLTWPDDALCADEKRGRSVLEALAPLDVGQGCVVGAGQIWAIETSGGTDHMLQTLPEGARKTRALLIKVPKTGQDLRVDMPTVGPDTISAVVDAGLAGLVIVAGQTILLERDETIRRADDAGLVVWSRGPV
ncbi:UDP-2,3-diacylglucosamine diphosphatase LpxI [uncultured Roseobacter sp.]|uniref:LpxI family protein n=1 Tax=uncultured Roseobacter sp. TaxID=114847 RepID=UPI002639591E|nr:UDP-2,3-diacylglucosamine diphosphatase LpxI [uncultured Roseobacter sp.]